MATGAAQVPQLVWFVGGQDALQLPHSTTVWAWLKTLSQASACPAYIYLYHVHVVYYSYTIILSSQTLSENMKIYPVLICLDIVWMIRITHHSMKTWQKSLYLMDMLYIHNVKFPSELVKYFFTFLYITKRSVINFQGTVVIWRHPGHFTSMKKLFLGAGLADLGTLIIHHTPSSSPSTWWFQSTWRISNFTVIIPVIGFWTLNKQPTKKKKKRTSHHSSLPFILIHSSHLCFFAQKKRKSNLGFA